MALPGSLGIEWRRPFPRPSPIIGNSAAWEGLGGAAIEVDDISGENSGRYEIAELIARAFPRTDRSRAESGISILRFHSVLIPKTL